MNLREVWAPARAVARIPSEMSSRAKPAKPKPTTSYEQIKADAGKAGKGCAWVIFYPFIMFGVAVGAQSGEPMRLAGLSFRIPGLPGSPRIYLRSCPPCRTRRPCQHRR
jgi:hypothetical protein